MNMTKGGSKLPYVIGRCRRKWLRKSSAMIAGIIERLDTHCKDQVITIHLESFYRALSPEDVQRVASGEYDFDDPTAFDFDLLTEALESLRKGIPIEIPKYDFVEHNRKGIVRLEPADIVIVEGVLIFYDKSLREKFNLKVFVKTDSKIRFLRRIYQEGTVYGRPLDVVLEEYTEKVKPAFEKYCQPTKKYADVIIPRAWENDVAIDLLVHYIQIINYFLLMVSVMVLSGVGIFNVMKRQERPVYHYFFGFLTIILNIFFVFVFIRAIVNWRESELFR